VARRRPDRQWLSGARCVVVAPVVISGEESDRYQSYVEGVNAYVVKPVEFDNSSAAVKQLGLFWLVINDPPPDRDSWG
jgi:hypothetical protein